MSDTFELDRVAWIQTELDLDFFLRGAVEGATEVTFDLETTGLDEHAETGGTLNGGVAARVVLASFTIEREQGGEPSTYILPLSHPESPFLGQWRATYTKVANALAEKRLIGHNVKYDARYTYGTTGVDLRHALWWDTAISSALLDENSSKKLKEVAPKTFGVDRWDDVELSTPGAAEYEPLVKLGEYAARDTYWTWKLYRNHRDRMFPDEPPAFAEDVEDARLGQLAQWVSMPTIRTLTGIEQRGLLLDSSWIEENISELEKVRDDSAETLVNLYPDTEETPENERLDTATFSFAPTSIWFKQWAERALAAGDLRVLSLTPSGKPQWSAAVLKKLARQGSEVAETLLNYRNAVKRLEFLHAWLDLKTPAGRIHSTYNAGTVVTGRLSSNSPNMQQITKKLKPAFTPSPGYYLAELDYSQIELRVAAFVSQCKPMIDAFKRGDDLHTLLAARINLVNPEDVTPDMRKQAKAGNFGLLYGMSPMGFQNYAETAYGVEMTEDEALKVHETFFEMWDGLRQWHARARRYVHAHGQVVSPLGRVRRLHDKVFDGNDRLVQEGERNAVNSPVQGMASDIMQIAGAVIDGNIPGFNAVEEARLVGTVHDSIMVEVPIDSWQETAKRCKNAMENVVPLVLEKMGVEFDVPLVADAEVGTRYGLADVGEL